MLATMGFAPATSVDAPDRRVDCRFRVHIHVEIPIGPSPQTTAFWSTDPGGGPLTCSGTIDGVDFVDAQGKLSLVGTLFGNCAGHTADVEVGMRLHLPNGQPYRHQLEVRNTRVLLNSAFVASSDELVGVGTLDVVRDQNNGEDPNCVTTPITGVTAYGRASLVNAA